MTCPEGPAPVQSPLPQAAHARPAADGRVHHSHRSLLRIVLHCPPNPATPPQRSSTPGTFNRRPQPSEAAAAGRPRRNREDRMAADSAIRRRSSDRCDAGLGRIPFRTDRQPCTTRDCSLRERFPGVRRSRRHASMTRVTRPSVPARRLSVTPLMPRTDCQCDSVSQCFW